MNRPSSIRTPALVACAAALLLGASLGCDLLDPPPICPDPDAPDNCGCLGEPCGDGMSCVSGACTVDGDDACGPARKECPSGSHCDHGECSCDPQLNASDPAACGCPAHECEYDFVDREACVAGTCTCDPIRHKENDGACGCPDPVACDNGTICREGTCTCDPSQHLSDSADCNCEGACEADRLCQAGRCVCPPGTTACGPKCLPLGMQCCSLAGDSCVAGSSCEAGPGGAPTCRPANTVACYENQAFVGFCEQGSRCVHPAGGMSGCIDANRNACYDDQGDFSFACNAQELCGPVGKCLAPGESRCGAGGDVVCPEAQVCQQSKAGWVCHPQGAVPCFADSLYVGLCPAGSTCTPDGRKCVPAGHSLCGDLITTCGPGSTCQRAKGGYECHPSGGTACFDGGGFYAGFCQAGWVCAPNDKCLPPNWSLCGNLVGSCPPGSTCQPTRNGGTTCIPNGTVPCFDGAGYCTGYCESGSSCTNNGCLPPGWSLCPDGGMCSGGSICRNAGGGRYSCQPSGTSPCFSREAIYEGFCDSWSVCEEKIDHSFHCIPTNNIRCAKDRYFHHQCNPGFYCTDNGCDR